jgi:hypothetical protein
MKRKRNFILSAVLLAALLLSQTFFAYGSPSFTMPSTVSNWDPHDHLVITIDNTNLDLQQDRSIDPPIAFDYVYLYKMLVRNVNADGFNIEIAVNYEAIHQNAILVFAYTTFRDLKMDENTIRLTANYQRSFSMRLSELDIISMHKDFVVLSVRVNALFPNTYYVYSMLKTDSNQTTCVLRDIASHTGRPSGIISGPSTVRPVQNRVVLISAEAQNISTDNRRFDLSVTVPAITDPMSTEIIVAWTNEAGLFINENNITTAWGITSSTNRLQSMNRTQETFAEITYTANINLWRPGVYYVYVMLRSGGFNSRIVQFTILIPEN